MASCDRHDDRPSVAPVAPVTPGVSTPVAAGALRPPWATGSSPVSAPPPDVSARPPVAVPGPGHQASEASGLAAGLRRAASDMKALAAAAMTRQYEGRSDDGAVTATADGGSRMAGVRISEHAVRSGVGPLAVSLTVAVNRALEAARRGTAEALLGAAGPGSQALLRATIDAAGDAARAVAREGAQPVTARSGDGSVTAAASVLGTVTGIAVSPAAVRLGGDGPARLGRSVAEAVNAALAEAGRLDRAQHNTATPTPAPGDPRSAGAVVLERLNHRMNELLGTLDQIDRDLDRLADGAAADLSSLADRMTGRGGDASGQAGS
jgi:DNA-binding protein YbaB